MLLNHPLNTQRHAIISVFFLYFLAVAALVVIFVQPYVIATTLTRDAVVISGGRFYHGFLSNIGILLWCAATIVCLFTFFILEQLKDKVDNRFFLYGGLLSLFLLLDDLFLLHEEVFPVYLSVNEFFILALYPIFVISFLIIYRYRIFATAYLVLLSSLGFLGLSMLVDVIFPYVGVHVTLFEDGLKFLGIVGWSYYFILTSYLTLKNILLLKVKATADKQVLSTICVSDYE